MTAEVEEIVVDADLVELQNFAPDLRDEFFDLRARLDETLIELWPFSIGRRQGIAVDLPVRG